MVAAQIENQVPQDCKETVLKIKCHLRAEVLRRDGQGRKFHSYFVLETGISFCMDAFKASLFPKSLNLQKNLRHFVSR